MAWQCTKTSSFLKIMIRLSRITDPFSIGRTDAPSNTQTLILGGVAFGLEMKLQYMCVCLSSGTVPHFMSFHVRKSETLQKQHGSFSSSKRASLEYSQCISCFSFELLHLNLNPKQMVSAKEESKAVNEVNRLALLRHCQASFVLGAYCAAFPNCYSTLHCSIICTVLLQD